MAAAFVKKDEEQTHSAYFRPLMPLLAAFIAGICAANLPENQTGLLTGLIWAAVAGAAISGGILVFRIYHQKPAIFSPLVFFFCLGYIAMVPWTASAPCQNQYDVFADGRTQRRISGRICGPIIFQGFRTVCLLDQLAISPDPAAPLDTAAPPEPAALRTPNGPSVPLVRVSGRIRMAVYGNAGGLVPGSILTCSSKIRPFRNFNNPGAFDYRKYMRFRQTWGNSYTASRHLIVQPAGNSVHQILAHTRQGISRHIDAAAAPGDALGDALGDAPGDANAILHALLLGDRTKISNTLRNAFNRAGISHILAISGLHIGIVASFAFFLTTRLLARIPVFLRHGWTRKGAAVLSLVPVISYGILAGMSPSTQRAVVMATVFLLTFLMARESDLANTIVLAAFVILTLHPPALFSISFQLSFAAVIAIFFGMAHLSRNKEPENQNRYVKSRLTKTIRSIGLFVIVSGLAILGTAPLTLHYFNQMSFAGIFSNLLFIPVIGFGVVPVGLFCVMGLLPIWPAAAESGLKACAFILTIAIDWIQKIADIPWVAGKTVTPNVLEIICFYLIAGAILVLIFSRTNRQIRQNRNKNKNAIKKAAGSDIGARFFPRYFPLQRKALLILLVSAAFLFVDAGYWIHQRFLKKEVRVSFLDVGQGNAALLEMPNGACALIDGGGYTDNTVFDIGERVVAPFLWRKKIATIETVFLTHFDADHANGLIYILRHFNVQQVYAPHIETSEAENPHFSDAVRANHINYPLYRDFPKKFAIHGVHFQILYPPENFEDLIKNETWRNGNNSSMVIAAAYKNHHFMFPGDIELPAEKELIASHAEIFPDVCFDILLAPHHGSKSSSSQTFINTIDPAVTVISAGFQNRFGFPDPAVLARYAQRHVKILRTDLNGCITMTTSDRQIRITPQIGEEFAIHSQSRLPAAIVSDVQRQANPPLQP